MSTSQYLSLAEGGIMDTTTLDIRTSISENLDQYADGDSDFKKELKRLMIEDLTEFSATLHKIPSQKDPSELSRVVHKIKVTLDILNYREFLNLIEETCHSLKVKRQGAIAGKLREVYMLCERIIRALQEESYA